MNAKDVLFSFKGRINRGKFIGYGILQVVIMGLLIFLAKIFDSIEQDILSVIVLVLAIIFAIWSSLALYIKRWDDLDKSGWWSLLILIPYLGAIVVLYLMIKKGTEGENRFGKDLLENENNELVEQG